MNRFRLNSFFVLIVTLAATYSAHAQYGFDPRPQKVFTVVESCARVLSEHSTATVEFTGGQGGMAHRIFDALRRVHIGFAVLPNSFENVKKFYDETEDEDFVGFMILTEIQGVNTYVWCEDQNAGNRTLVMRDPSFRCVLSHENLATAASDSDSVQGFLRQALTLVKPPRANDVGVDPVGGIMPIYGSGFGSSNDDVEDSDPNLVIVQGEAKEGSLTCEKVGNQTKCTYQKAK
jgi:hypothetical protein